MIKVALIVGHTERRPGAWAQAPVSSAEYFWNKDLAEQMKAHVATLGGAEAKVFLRDEIGVVGVYNAVREWGAESAVELHFNAAGPTASGSETLYVTLASRHLAEAVQDATVSSLGLRDRGVKTPQDASGGRGERNLKQMGPKPSILTEPFFGSNTGDARIAAERKRELAVAQADAVVNCLKSMDTDDSRTVTVKALNVRGGPGVDFEKVSWGPLANGAVVEVIAQHGGWAFVRTESGKGFVYASFLA